MDGMRREVRTLEGRHFRTVTITSCPPKVHLEVRRGYCKWQRLGTYDCASAAIGAAALADETTTERFCYFLSARNHRGTSHRGRRRVR